MDNDELTQLPNANYEKLFAKFPEIETLPLDSWKVPHFIAYFMKKYKDYYKTNYKFSFSNPAPSKCKEYFTIKRISSRVSNFPSHIKEYIDWVFDNKLKNRRRQSSITCLVQEEFMNEFKEQYQLVEVEKVVERSTSLPVKYIMMARFQGFEVSSYGELCFVLMSASRDPKAAKLKQVLENSDFNFELLNNVV
jgi:hypothetical protein